MGGASSSFSFAGQMTIFLGLTDGASLGYTSAAARTEICHFLMKVWGALKVLHLAEAEEGRRQSEGGKLAVSEKEEGRERKMREQREEGEERGTEGRKEKERGKDDRISLMQ